MSVALRSTQIDEHGAGYMVRLYESGWLTRTEWVGNLSDANQLSWVWAMKGNVRYVVKRWDGTWIQSFALHRLAMEAADLYKVTGERFFVTCE